MDPDRVTVLHDLDAARVIFVCQGRDKGAVERFAADLHAHGGSAKNVSDACTDLSKAFIGGVTEHLPNATLSFDRSVSPARARAGAAVAAVLPT